MPRARISGLPPGPEAVIAGRGGSTHRRRSLQHEVGDRLVGPLVQSVPLRTLLPSGLAWRERAGQVELLAAALDAGDDSRITQAIASFVENQALRRLIEPVEELTVDLREEPMSRPGGEVQLVAELAGIELPMAGGKLSLAAIDRISVTPFGVVVLHEQVAAQQLAAILELTRMTAELADPALGLLRQMAAHPERFAYNDVEQILNAAARLETGARALHATALGDNRDQGNSLMIAIVRAASLREAAERTLAVAGDFMRAHQPDWSPGKAYIDFEEREYAQGGVHYISGAAGELWHLAGNAISAGEMNRRAHNVIAYEEGRISWEAYNENTRWNYLSSSVQAIVAALAGAVGFELDALLGATLGPGTTAFLSGSGVGAAQGAAGAMAGDAMAMIAAHVSDNPHVQEYQRAMIGGPESWAWSALTGAAVGGAVGRLGAEFQVPRQSAELQAHWFDPQLELKIAMASPDVLPALPPTWLARLEPVELALAGKDVIGASRMLGAMKSELPPGLFARIEAELTRRHGVTAPSVYRDPFALLPDGRAIGPTDWGSPRYYGADIADDVAERMMLDGLGARGPNLSLDKHARGAEDTAYRGTTSVILTSSVPGEQQGAGAWAGDGGWVFKIDGVPSWDVNASLQGRVRLPDGTHTGSLMSGEIEHAILAQVPTERIVEIYKIEQVRGSLQKVRTIRNPNYRHRAGQ